MARCTPSTPKTGFSQTLKTLHKRFARSGKVRSAVFQNRHFIFCDPDYMLSVWEVDISDSVNVSQIWGKRWDLGRSVLCVIPPLATCAGVSGSVSDWLQGALERISCYKKNGGGILFIKAFISVNDETRADHSRTSISKWKILSFEHQHHIHRKRST